MCWDIQGLSCGSGSLWKGPEISLYSILVVDHSLSNVIVASESTTFWLCIVILYLTALTLTSNSLVQSRDCNFRLIILIIILTITWMIDSEHQSCDHKSFLTNNKSIYMQHTTCIQEACKISLFIIGDSINQYMSHAQYVTEAF